MNNGIKPLNNLLDTLSYITLLTNEATAAYDFKNDENVAINVELANQNNTFVGFDSKEYKLSEKDIVVKNNDNIVCLAGILGDKNHGINGTTKTAYIEFANFNHTFIRNTSSKHNIRTDAARRNSKHVPKFSTLLAASMFYTYFPNAIYNVEITSEVPKAIEVNFNFINELMGTNYSQEDILKHLDGLGFISKDSNLIIPPLYRTDVLTNADVAEELIKSIDVNEIEEESIDISGVRENKYTEYYFIKKM
jgi:phenylalanyl-tRNA synthetase beta chain